MAHTNLTRQSLATQAARNLRAAAFDGHLTTGSLWDALRVFTPFLWDSSGPEFVKISFADGSKIRMRRG